MTDDDRYQDIRPDDIDPGDPIPELSGLREEPSRRFRHLVLDSINRRIFTSQAIDVPWWGISSLFLEYLQMFFKALGVKEDEKREG